MHRRRIASLLLGVLGVFALASVAHATTLLKLDMDDLVDRSERIVHGEVTKLEAKEEQGRIVTYITLDVQDSLKGPADEKTVSFRVLGGRMGDLVTIVHGTPQFSVGEQVLGENPVQPVPQRHRLALRYGANSGKQTVAGLFKTEHRVAG